MAMLVSCGLAAAGCAAAGGGQVGTDSATAAGLGNSPDGRAVATAGMPCDPHGGFPQPASTCPDSEPETGWLTMSGDQATLTRFRTLANDDEGRAYAEAQGVEFPFPNDYFDAATGVKHLVDLAPGTVCTGIIRVGYREPLQDHSVNCGELLEVAASGRLPVALWSTDAGIVQVSELYRP